MTTNLRWWQRAVFYQVYPRSFADADGDGIGDLAGLTARLDYLQSFGIDGIWLSPHYPSPQFDCGYDIADYTGVAPEYGTMDDFGRFIGEAHRRGMRVILDLVLNHTSDQHQWFRESRGSRNNAKSDWYVWQDPVNGGPPNNWIAGFGGPAWEYEPARGQYYYHFFFKEQPDLNWRKPEVKQAMWQAVRFWLDRGVDGFRLDAIGTIYEDEGLPDNTGHLDPGDLVRAISAETGSPEHADLIKSRAAMTRHQLDQPGLHELMQELRALVDQYPDRMLVGETEDLSYCGTGENELHMVFNFPLMKTAGLTASAVRANQALRLAACPPGAWPCNTLGNHDTSRLISRIAGDHSAEWARLGAGLLLTLRGTPFLYYGDEIGMTDLYLGHVGAFRDMWGVWYFHALVEILGMAPSDALAEAARFTRDKCRTPMQWTPGLNAGFSPPGVETWLPVHANHAQGVNVAQQEADTGSLLSFYRRLVAVRRTNPALVAGEYISLGRVDEADECLAYLRRVSEQTCLVVLNMSGQSLELDLVERLGAALAGTELSGGPAARLLFSSRERAVGSQDPAKLGIGPFEVCILDLG